MQFSLENHRRLNPRSGLTLVELLVVIAIISIVSAATIPLFSPPVDDQKTREASRLFATMIESARSRAVETGRPAGIWLQLLPAPAVTPPLTTQAWAADTFTCETPEPYSGVSISDTVTVQRVANGIQLIFPNGFDIKSLCHYGDLVRFNNSGESFPLWYTPTAVGKFGQPLEPPLPDPTPPTCYLGRNNYQNYPGFVPTALGSSTVVPFQILRKPNKGAGVPMSLPTTAPAAIIDLNSSGVGLSGNQFTNARAGGPVLITFEPSGQVSEIQYFDGSSTVSVSTTGSIYFLIRLNKDGDAAVAPGSGHTDQTATWVSINPTTGLVSVSDNMYGNGFTSIADAREAAKKASQKGGL